MRRGLRQWCVLWLGLSACGPLQRVADTSSDLPVAGLDEDWRRAFDEGDRLFDTPFRAADGLGPLYIRQACSSCHAGAARGPGIVERMVVVDAAGAPSADQSALPWGTVVRPHATSGATPVLAPARADVLVTRRAGVPIMGRGWLEAIDAAEIVRVEAEQAMRRDGVSGRINWVRRASARNDDTRFHQLEQGARVIGRFGLKARVGTLDDFAADALQGDMGLTSPLRPTEIANPEGLTDDGKPGLDLTLDEVNALAQYVRTVALPTRAEPNARGAALFADVGCTACHVPMLRTSPGYPIAPLANTDAAVFSDLLLHDLGPTFSDGLVDFDAAPSEWKTAPLIGLRFLTAYLHDGRARDVRTAIELHGAEGSEARASVLAFTSLPADDLSALLTFVSSL